MSMFSQREGAEAIMTPWERIHDAYDPMGGYKLDPKLNFGSLQTEEERLKALAMLTQTGSGDMGGMTACGAATLVGGSMLANGVSGMNTLFDAALALNMKNQKGVVDPAKIEENAALVAELKKLQASLADPEHGGVTAGDMGTAIRDIYGLLAPGQEGTPDKVVADLFKSSPALRKMWKDHDLSYDGIDHNGDGQSDHAVLGIGHQGRHGQGPHEKVWDPWKRKAAGQDEAHEQVMEYERQVADRTYTKEHPHPTYWEDGKEKLYSMASPDLPREELEKAREHERQVRAADPSTQLITGEADLMDYWLQTMKSVDGSVHSQHNKPVAAPYW